RPRENEMPRTAKTYLWRGFSDDSPPLSFPCNRQAEGTYQMIPVVATRLRPPTRAGATVPREALPAALAHLRSRRLLLVRAPAGYGKSLLMAQLHAALRASNPGATTWVSVGDMGASLQEVAMYCATALAPAAPGVEAAF